jgi:hypothetical protein
MNESRSQQQMVTSHENVPIQNLRESSNKDKGNLSGNYYNDFLENLS